MFGLIEADTALLSVRFVLCRVPIKFYAGCYHKMYVQTICVRSLNLPLHSISALLGLMVTRGIYRHSKQLNGVLAVRKTGILGNHVTTLGVHPFG